MRICLDPGHGGGDPGAIGYGRREKEEMLWLALEIRMLLEARGVEVILTRDTDIPLPIPKRCAIANREKCDYLVSLHRDTACVAVSGISAWVYSKAAEETTAKARIILDEVLAVAPTKDRGVRKGTPHHYADYGVNAKTDMPSVMLELGFITSVADNERFDQNFAAYANAIANALCKIAEGAKSFT